jgi:hypothetical protein
LSGYSKHRGPDIPDYEPDSPDITWNFTGRLFLVVDLIVMAFVGSLVHNYHINTCGSKSLLIVQRSLSVFNRLPTEGYTQGGKFWVRRRRYQELEGARNTRLLDRFGPHGA